MLLQFARFLMVGIGNTLIGFSIISGAKYLFGIGNVSANFIGYAVGLTVSFLLNKGWTFAYKGPKANAAVRFGLVFAVSYLLNLATVLVAIDVAHINGYIGQALGIPPYTLCFFLLSKYFVFRDQPEKQMVQSIETTRNG